MRDPTQYLENVVAGGTALGIVLIALKLAGVLPWRWIWVLFPLWLGYAVGAVMLVLGVILVVLGMIQEKHEENRKDEKDK